MSVSDSDDSGSINSMLHVRASELYPKKQLIETHETASIVPPFVPLYGESIEFMGRITDGVLALSNYRVYFQRAGRDGRGDFNIPLGLIETAEMKDLFHVYFHCKDVKTYRCSFPSNDACVDWFRRISRNLAPRNVDDLFAFAYYAWAREEGSEEVFSCFTPNLNNTEYFRAEYVRMGFDEDRSWRVVSNEDYRVCPSYPKSLIVPVNFTDTALDAVAKFRSSRRIPIVVWRHKENGMVIARSSQPEVGWFGWRSQEDEELLKCLSDACSSKAVTRPKLLVIDARSYTTAVANRARGGGCECPEYYPNIDIKFMNLANIHCIRKSFQSLRQLCASGPDQLNWHSLLENTKWLSHMSLLIQAAVRVVTAIEKHNQPVLVHCSDGWDRTTQIVSLAELLLDPYYRTIEGFQALCEREWLDFGHKFADRCGYGEDPNEKCPVFLQWLDCVHNIVQQFPCAFEFSKRYLIRLAEHTYSNLFGTFLCNTNQERLNLGIGARTFSVWKYLQTRQFRNYLYDKNHERVLWPQYNVRDLEVWRDLYLDLVYDNQYIDDNECSRTENNDQNVTPEVENDALNNLGNKVEPMLLSAINSCPEINGEHIRNGGGGADDTNSEDGENTPPIVAAAAATVAAAAADDDDEEPIASCIETMLNKIDADFKITPAADCKVAPLVVIDGTDDVVGRVNNRDDDDDGGGGGVSKMTNGHNGALLDNLCDDVYAVDIINSNANTVVDDSDKELAATLAASSLSPMPLSSSPSNRETLAEEEEDCDDILIRRRTRETSENFEDSNKIVDELEMRLMNGGGGGNGGNVVDCFVGCEGDNSVQSSVETIVDNNTNFKSANHDSCEYKTVSIGLKNHYDPLVHLNGRRQLTSLLLDPIDGLPLIPDDVQDRMQEISIEHKAELAAARNELHQTRHALVNKICNQCTHQMIIPPERPIISDDDKGSVCSTEISWEAVDEKDVGQILWVPDYAVNFCTGCNSRFWIGRRKHHCRGCGKIFCADCSRNVVSLPNEQLFDPVRVCADCYQLKRVSSSCLSYAANSPKQTTCKQAAAGEEQQNSNIVLNPMPPI